MKFPTMITENKSRGVTLFLTVLILASALSISLGIFYIVFVQLQINRGAKESYAALYAAEAGKECALYYRYQYKWTDPKNTALNGGFWSPTNACAGSGSCTISCAGQTNIPVTISDISGLTQAKKYKFNLPGTNGVCTDVTVKIQKRTEGTNTVVETLVDAVGKNSCVSTNFLVNRILQYCDNGKGKPCTLVDL